jgi:hypothetical protein
MSLTTRQLAWPLPTSGMAIGLLTNRRLGQVQIVTPALKSTHGFQQGSNPSLA